MYGSGDALHDAHDENKRLQAEIDRLTQELATTRELLAYVQKEARELKEKVRG